MPARMSRKILLRSWGVPDNYQCEVVENNAPVPKHVPLHRPGGLPKEFYSTLETLQLISKEPPAVASSESKAM
ncbi:hypothetical protein LINGRAHAP2_LOCUS5081 [Linum grandiflorum]